MWCRRTVTERALLAAGLSILGVACAAQRGPVNPALAAAAQRDPLAVSDALEALIADGADTPADRAYAYQVVSEQEQDGAAYALARATVTGREVQQRGLLGADQVAELESWAQRSRELDPDFRDGAATRLLGTLYVLAPASLLAHGDSERGLELLERLVQVHPTTPNRLRLAEAYIALGDPAQATPELCACLADPSALRGDERKLLQALVATAGPPRCDANS